MATIDIKIKSYDELTFEITKLNTDLYLKNKEIERLNNIIDELEKYCDEEMKKWGGDVYMTLLEVKNRLKELKGGE